jgi:hypothetical protein
VLIFLFGIQLLITTDNIKSVEANTVLLLCVQWADIRPRQTSGFLLLVWWRHLQEILCTLPTVKTARTLRLYCLSSNCMEYSANWDVLIVQVMYKLRSLSKHTGSMSRSECLALVTAVKFVNIMVLDFGLWLYLSYSNTIFLLILHFKFLIIIIGIDFNIILVLFWKPTFFEKCIERLVPHSRYIAHFI